MIPTIKKLLDRDIVSNITPSLKELPVDRKLVVYAGFDPTASSLHLGHLAVLNQLRRFAEDGKPAWLKKEKPLESIDEIK